MKRSYLQSTGCSTYYIYVPIISLRQIYSVCGWEKWMHIKEREMSPSPCLLFYLLPRIFVDSIYAFKFASLLMFRHAIYAVLVCFYCMGINRDIYWRMWSTNDLNENFIVRMCRPSTHIECDDQTKSEWTTCAQIAVNQMRGIANHKRSTYYEGQSQEFQFQFY